MTMIRYFLEAVLAVFLFSLLRLLPLDMASAFGGRLGRAIGPCFRADTIARKNLKMIYPDMPPQERERIITRMWDNLGRNAAELAYLPGKMLLKRLSVSGLENMPKPGQGAIFVSGHLGNWELGYPVVHAQGIPVILIYRHINNPFIDRMIAWIRGAHSTDMFSKSDGGSFRMIRAIKNGESFALLIDQKMNEGIAVPFFGRAAMTAPAIAQLSLRYNLPIIPARVVRKEGCHFEEFIYPPLAYERTGDEEKDVLSIMTSINALLESWIREYPEQWFWVHKRWPE